MMELKIGEGLYQVWVIKVARLLLIIEVVSM
jgi:hypothetical protein